MFTVNEGYVDYNAVFAKSALTVTDYSSVIFDFAYLRKYIIYAQFDKEQFFENQVYDEGYFSYEKDGFGPVCTDLESTVDALIKAVEQDCRVPKKYIDRVNTFFAFDDQKNSERIYQAIMEHDACKQQLPEMSPRLEREIPAGEEDEKLSGKGKVMSDDEQGDDGLELEKIE